MQREGRHVLVPFQYISINLVSCNVPGPETKGTEKGCSGFSWELFSINFVKCSVFCLVVVSDPSAQNAWFRFRVNRMGWRTWRRCLTCCMLLMLFQVGRSRDWSDLGPRRRKYHYYRLLHSLTLSPCKSLIRTADLLICYICLDCFFFECFFLLFFSLNGKELFSWLCQGTRPSNVVDGFLGDRMHHN